MITDSLDEFVDYMREHHEDIIISDHGNAIELSWSDRRLSVWQTDGKMQAHAEFHKDHRLVVQEIRVQNIKDVDNATTGMSRALTLVSDGKEITASFL